MIMFATGCIACILRQLLPNSFSSVNLCAIMSPSNFLWRLPI